MCVLIVAWCKGKAIFLLGAIILWTAHRVIRATNHMKLVHRFLQNKATTMSKLRWQYIISCVDMMKRSKTNPISQKVLVQGNFDIPRDPPLLDHGAHLAIGQRPCGFLADWLRRWHLLS